MIQNNQQATHTKQDNPKQVTASGIRPSVLHAEHLRKAYGARAALQDLSFSLQAGHVLGFLGPNGAGKTTAIRILTTIMEPTSGQFTVDGIPSTQPVQVRNKIGVLPESLGFHKQITGIECLTYFGQLYGRTAADAKENGWTLLKEVGLEQRGKSLIGSYSRGMRQRLGIARAMVNDPVVVFLDEPTLGLDPRGQQELLSLIRQIAYERNTGIILCSHALTEIEGVCDDVVILNAGQVVAAGTVMEVIGGTKRHRTLQNVLRIRVPSTSIEVAQKLVEAIPDVVKVTATSEVAGWLRIETSTPAEQHATDQHAVNNKLLSALIEAQIPILNFEAEGGRLQDVFFELTEEQRA